MRHASLAIGSLLGLMLLSVACSGAESTVPAGESPERASTAAPTATRVSDGDSASPEGQPTAAPEDDAPPPEARQVLFFHTEW